MLQVQNNHTTYIKGLVAGGSNLGSSAGDARETVAVASQLIAGESVRLLAQSRYFRTPAFPAGSGPDFVNAAFLIESDLPPRALLDHLHQIEARLGRTRKQRWEARAIDLDLLAYGAEILPNEVEFDHWASLSADLQARQAPDQLILPHPRLHQRGFVLVPLMDIAPDWRHPRLGLTVREMLARLPAQELAEITPLD